MRIGPLVFSCLLFCGLAAAQTAQTKNISDAHCTITVPADWVSATPGGGSAHAPDRSMMVMMRGLRREEIPSVVADLKKTKGNVVDDTSSHVLVQAPLSGAKKQWVQITKTSPFSCRASVSYSTAGKADAARKIAESVRPRQ